MKDWRPIVIGLIVLALAIFWRISGSPNPQQESTAPIGDVPASQAKEYTLEVGDSTILDFTEAAGSITIFAGPPGQVHAIVTKRTLGVDKESAQQDLRSFTVEPQQNGGTISLGVGRNAKPGRQVDYKITAPPDTSVNVASGYGNITIDGLKGNVNINGQNLNITLKDIRGAIAIQSETGSVKLADTTGDLQIQSHSAWVQLDRATGPSTFIATAANTTIKDSGAETSATFRIQNGDLTLTRFRAQALTAVVPGGQIRINESTAQEADLQTQDGTINLFRVNTENLRAATTTGQLTLDQVQGSFDIKTQKGAVNLTEAAATALNITAGSGNVLFYGALPVEGKHTIKTSSGNISIFVVKESAFQLDASTKGTITIDPPFVLESVEQTSNHWRGVINGGRVTLVLSSASGNILISSEQPF